MSIQIRCNPSKSKLRKNDEKELNSIKMITNKLLINYEEINSFVCEFKNIRMLLGYVVDGFTVAHSFTCTNEKIRVNYPDKNYKSVRMLYILRMIDNLNINEFIQFAMKYQIFINIVYYKNISHNIMKTHKLEKIEIPFLYQ